MSTVSESKAETELRARYRIAVIKRLRPRMTDEAVEKLALYLMDFADTSVEGEILRQVPE